jgi:hypothetical protein
LSKAVQTSVVFHVPAAVITAGAAMPPFYAKAAEVLTQQGVKTCFVPHQRATTLAQIEADRDFHIIDRGRIRHPRALNTASAYIAPFFYLDPMGVRTFSSLAELPFEADRVDPHRAQRFHNNLRARLVTARKSRYEQPSEVLAIPQHCIAVFLQSEGERDVDEACYFNLRQMIRALLARADPRPIVVKPHPMDSDLDTLAWLVQKARKDSRLQIIPANIHDILAQADVVVTINSAVGIEAMLDARPVVLCGHADFRACAETARSPNGLDAAISQAEAKDWPFAAFLHWFFVENCLSLRAKDFGPQLIARITATGFSLP